MTKRWVEPGVVMGVAFGIVCGFVGGRLTSDAPKVCESGWFLDAGTPTFDDGRLRIVEESDRGHWVATDLTSDQARKLGRTMETWASSEEGARETVDYCLVEVGHAISPIEPLGPEVEAGWALWGHLPGHNRKRLLGVFVRREEATAKAEALRCVLREGAHE